MNIAGWMAAFHKQYPDVEFRLFHGDVDAALERIDKGLTNMGLLLGPICRISTSIWSCTRWISTDCLCPQTCPLGGQERVNIGQLKTLSIQRYGTFWSFYAVKPVDSQRSIRDLFYCCF